MTHLRRAIATTGWGVYCASSWTWCIGMFLPIILLGRYGWWGFLAFALPNVLGCAAFGYVLRTPERSRQCVENHKVAMQIFSLVTIAFHVFFLAFLLWLLLPTEGYALQLAVITPVAMLFLALVLSDVPDRIWPWLAGAAYVVSLTTFAAIGTAPLQDIGWQGDHATIDAAWLLPVMIFGFVLCPYLDLTFHRALQQSPSNHAFGVFGITFAIMIVLTCAYWDILESSALLWLVLGHVVMQSAFTVSAHMREVRLRLTVPLRDPRHYMTLLSPLLALPVAFIGAFTLDPLAMSLDNYLRMLVFYGLAFPAYVLLFMTPRSPHMTRRTGIAFALLLVALAPMYEAGFLHSQAWILLAPPVVLLLIQTWRSIGRAPELEDGAVETAR